jgi:hypothetical protein
MMEWATDRLHRTNSGTMVVHIATTHCCLAFQTTVKNLERARSIVCFSMDGREHVSTVGIVA